MTCFRCGKEATEVLIVYDGKEKLRYHNSCFEKAKKIGEISYCEQFEKWLYEGSQDCQKESKHG